jgi:hypothetical protein
MQTPQAFQSVMHAAQATFDNMAPPDYDEDALTEEQARDEATALFLASGACVAEVLDQICDPEGPLIRVAGCVCPSMPGRDAENIAALCEPEYDSHGKPAHQLLAVLFSADSDADRLAALNALRDLVIAGASEYIEDTTRSLLRADERAREQEPS